jgi:hypothetical protein
MTRLARAGLVAALATLAPGCTTFSVYKMIEPQARAIDGAYTVEPRLAWSSIVSGKQETWTIDGVLLESLRFFKGVTEGEPMLRGGADENRRARFHPSMTPTEVTEFVADSLYGSRYPPKSIRPAPFGGAPGFRLEVSYATRDGVRRDALVAGAVLQGRLHVIAYDGTSLHHFARYRDEAEAIIASIRLK